MENTWGARLLTCDEAMHTSCSHRVGIYRCCELELFHHLSDRDQTSTLGTYIAQQASTLLYVPNRTEIDIGMVEVSVWCSVSTAKFKQERIAVKVDRGLEDSHGVHLCPRPSIFYRRN